MPSPTEGLPDVKAPCASGQGNSQEAVRRLDSIVEFAQRLGGISGVAATAQERKETQERVGKETMSRVTYVDKQMQAYCLFNPDYQDLSVNQIAEEMGTSQTAVEWLLARLERDHPDLFTDISSDGRRPAYKTVRYGGWADGEVKQKF